MDIELREEQRIRNGFELSSNSLKEQYEKAKQSISNQESALKKEQESNIELNKILKDQTEKNAILLSKVESLDIAVREEQRNRNDAELSINNYKSYEIKSQDLQENLDKSIIENKILNQLLSNIFPYEIYAKKRPDLIDKGFDNRSLLNHFIAHSLNEKSNLSFDHIKKYYLSGKRIDSINSITAEIIIAAQNAAKNENLILCSVLYFYLDRYKYIGIDSNYQTFQHYDVCIINECAEATILLCENYVFKIYNVNYFRWNNTYNRIHEPELREFFSSKLIHEPVSFSKIYLQLPFLGQPIGPRIKSAFDSVKIILKKDQILELIIWLDKIKDQLLKESIHHNDINFSNILFDIINLKFSLIDFTWASKITKDTLNFQKKLPEYLNNSFLNDNIAFKELTLFLVKQLISEYELHRDFLKPDSNPILIFSLPRYEFSSIYNDQYTEDDICKVISNYFNDPHGAYKLLFFGCNLFSISKNLYDLSSKIDIIEDNPYLYRLLKALTIFKHLSNINCINFSLNNSILGNLNKSYDGIMFSDIICKSYNSAVNFNSKLISSLFNKTNLLLYQTILIKDSDDKDTLFFHTYQELKSYLELFDFSIFNIIYKKEYNKYTKIIIECKKSYLDEDS